ncbi:efflux RND transporter periplasmic adaptor subunit [Caldimonas sp. KR1-144]|uniref:efflux RND transporter periplasmic adaptor subunit n=1 Tax=Caldimonas sp. KR1-144 TaxID=3400911 RepID=UPI003C043054
MITPLRPSLLALALLPLLPACGSRDEPAPEPLRPVRSIVVGASAGSVGATYAGTIAARHESKLGFQASGKLVARHVELGSRVKRGQVLMRLDPAQESLHVVSATADVDAATSRVAQLRVDLGRTEQLLARNFASQAELDQQRQALAEAESQLKSARARQQINLNQRGYTELVADRDGVVTAINAEAGQVVSAGQHVVTVAADGEREVAVSVPESRVDELRRAKTLEVSLWAAPGKRFAGTLRELAPEADRLTRTYAARIAVKDAGDALMLGMTASVFTPNVAGASAIRVPLSAVYSRDGRTLVWLVDAKTSQVRTQAVELGAAHNDEVLVAKGLSGGETVVTAGVHRLHEGQRVAIANAPLAAKEAQR